VLGGRKKEKKCKKMCIKKRNVAMSKVFKALLMTGPSEQLARRFIVFALCYFFLSALVAWTQPEAVAKKEVWWWQRTL